MSVYLSAFVNAFDTLTSFPTCESVKAPAFMSFYWPSKNCSWGYIATISVLKVKYTIWDCHSLFTLQIINLTYLFDFLYLLKSTDFIMINSMPIWQFRDNSSLSPLWSVLHNVCISFSAFSGNSCTRPFYRTRDHIMSLLRPRASSFISQFLSPGPAFYIYYFFILQRSCASCTLCLHQFSL